MVHSFSDLGVLPAFTERLAERRITRPTAVQSLVIPRLLEGHSLIFRSATGTGKTFAYLIPALQMAGAQAGPAVLVCAPTMELCSQIRDEAVFLVNGACAVNLLIGSAGMERQIEALKKNKPLAVVGNPGRLLLLAKMGKLALGGLRYLVLDEADRLTAQDCREDMAALAGIIAAKTRNTKLTVAACSATVSETSAGALGPLLEGAPLVVTDEHEILRERIEHWAVFSESRAKTQTLISFIAAVQPKKMLVFTGRGYEAGKTAAILQGRGIAAVALYSGMDKKLRKEAIDRFRSGKALVLVSSDIAARGLDIPGISHVAALETGDNKDAYIHRAGRTGRAGKRGVMVSIGDETEMRRLALLEKKLGITVNPKELYRGRLFTPTTE